MTVCLALALRVALDSRPIAGGSDERLPELVRVSPGIQVGNNAPKGWSHLIIKSMPSLQSGDSNSLPATARSTATLFRTVIVANVARSKSLPDRFCLDRVGLGLCVPHDGSDVVVESSSASAAKSALGLIELHVLGRAEQELNRGRLIVRSPTFALFAGPSTLLVRSVHEAVMLNYAILVEPRQGSLSTLVWPSSTEAGAKPAPRELVLLPPNAIFQSGLDVAAERLLGTIPVSWSFALRSLPPGTRLRIPDEFRSALADPRRLHEDVNGLESRLREIASRAADEDRPRPTPLPSPPRGVKTN
jgi:hypothetical protein